VNFDLEVLKKIAMKTRVHIERTQI